RGRVVMSRRAAYMIGGGVLALIALLISVQSPVFKSKALSKAQGAPAEASTDAASAAPLAGVALPASDYFPAPSRAALKSHSNNVAGRIESGSSSAAGAVVPVSMPDGTPAAMLTSGERTELRQQVIEAAREIYSVMNPINSARHAERGHGLTASR